MLEMRGIGFSYGERAVLRDVDVRVDAGRIVGLLGPNGSGKSTLLKLAGGVLSGHRGAITVAGEAAERLSRRERARRIAMVPQESTFGFPFSALEIVLMGRHPHLAGLSFESQADLELAREALRRCGAADLADRPIQELSSGERQRVVFARALAQQPRMLLLDEPASFLDIRHQIALYDIVRELAVERGCAVLTALHDLNLTAEYCDYVYLLRDGRVAAGGAAGEVLTQTNLARVFDAEVYVGANPASGKPLIVPLPGRKTQKTTMG